MLSNRFTGSAHAIILASFLEDSKIRQDLLANAGYHFSNYRFDWCLVLPPGVTADNAVSEAVIPANRFGTLHCRGDIYKVDRAWQFLFHLWLPRSGYQPTHDPAMEVFPLIRLRKTGPSSTSTAVCLCNPYPVVRTRSVVVPQSLFLTAIEAIFSGVPT